MQIIDDNLDFTVDYNGFNFSKSQMTTKTQNISASQFFFYSSVLLAYQLEFLNCSLGGITSKRSSQLINARGKKLNVVAKSTKATQTTSAGAKFGAKIAANSVSTSASMASVRNLTPGPTVQDQNNQNNQNNTRTSPIHGSIVVPNPGVVAPQGSTPHGSDPAGPVPVAVVNPLPDQPAQLKDRTLFQRLFQR